MTNIIATVSVLAILLLSLACGTKPPTESNPVEETPIRNVSAENASAESIPVEKSPTESVPTQSISTENDPIAEYAQLACAGDLEDDSPDDATWGDAVERMEEVIDVLEGITPPAELRDYHNASVALSKRVLDFAKDKPEDELLNQFEMLGTPEFMVLAMTVGSLQDELPDDVRDEFVQAGCSSFQPEPTATPRFTPTPWPTETPWPTATPEYTRYQDPLTDDVTLFFGVRSLAEDGGNLILRAECGGDVQVFVDVNIMAWDGGEQTLLVRFDEEALQEEVWIWEEIKATTERRDPTWLRPSLDRAVETLEKLIASEKLAVRYPEEGSISEMTFIFDTTELQDLWSREGLKGCEG